MSSLLRSSKFVRYFAGFARNFISSSSHTNFEGAAIRNVVSLHPNFTKSLATQATNTQSQYTNNLERSLQQLDQDVRRIGRISRRDIEDVLEEIRNTRTATSSQSLLVIRCCGNLVPEELPEVRTKLVNEIWSTLEKLNVPMDISHYNALLRVYLENEHQFSPTKFLEDLEKKGVEPNRVTFQRLITRYCQQGDIQGATKILEFMREKNLPVNESVFNALVMGHSQADDMESAAGILAVMRQAGLDPSADTYTTLLCGHAKKGDMDSIRAVLEEADAKDIYLLDKDHMDVVYALAKHGFPQYVDELIVRMRKSTGYNQDAVHLILRLVNEGQEEVALKVLRTMTRAPRYEDNTLPSYTGTFFIKQLLKANRPVEVILDVCGRLEKEGLHSKALSIAVEASVTSGNIDQACTLLEALRDKGFPIRQHYFWPLICAAGKLKDNEGVGRVVKQMMTKFDLSPSGETVREYLIPNLTEGNSEKIVGFLKSLGVASGTAAVSLVHELLISGNIKEAASVASKFRAFYMPNLLRRPLINAYQRTNDVESLVAIMHHIYDSVDSPMFAGEDAEGQDVAKDRAEVVGQYLLDLVNAQRRGGSGDLKPVLEGLVSKGLGISSDTAELIQSKLSGEKLTNEISTLLEKLASGGLEPSPVVRQNVSFGYQAGDEASLVRRIAAAEETGTSAVGYKRILLSMYCKNKDVENAEKLLESLGEEAPIGCYAHMLDMYTSLDKPDKAVEYYESIVKKFPGISLDPIKMVKVCGAALQAERTEEALKILDALHVDAEKDWAGIGFGLKAASFQLLNNLAEKGDVRVLKAVFNRLVDKQIVEVSNVMLGPLMKVHVIRDDLVAALDQFEECCTKYNSTPWKGELARKLIEKEDAAALQRLTDLSTKVHGEVNSLYDLVFAFVDCGRTRQARKILETPGLYNRPQRLNSICERYRLDGSVGSLERLIEATRDITHIDRTEMFNQLLLSYISTKETDKALGLWTQMQDEDVQPSDVFLARLGTFLQQEGRSVPFVVPKVEQPVVTGGDVATEPAVSSPSLAVTGIRNAIRMKQMDKALDLYKTNTLNLHVSDVSDFVEGLVQFGKLQDAHKIVMASLKKKQLISLKVMRFCLNRIAESGDVEKLKQIEPYLDVEQKKLFSFDNKLCHAYTKKGGAADYMDILVKELETAKPGDIARLEEKFPRGAIHGILEKHPELIPRYEKLAARYYELGVSGPINALWSSYFVTPELSDKADVVWDEYLKKNPRVMFHRVVQHCHKTLDEKLATKLFATLRTSAVSDRGKGLAVSCILDVLMGKGKTDEAVSELTSALTHIKLEDMNQTALRRVKTGLEAQGKSFPYSIPAKVAAFESSSSDSSSDDEASKKPKTE